MKLYNHFGQEVSDMALYQDILSRLFQRSDIHVTISGLSGGLPELTEIRCFQAIQRIRAILNDESLSDKECFMHVEEIVLALEDLGSDGGSRHDFG